MQRYFILFCIFCSLLLGSTYPKATTLDGRWFYHVEHMPHTKDYTYHFTGKEPSMQLPNNWYKQGINHAGVMWFQKEFNTQSLPQASQHYIEFSGVDYQCDVWINNHYLGSHSGYFQTFSFDMTPYLRKGINSLKIKVNSPLENYPEHYSLHKTLLRGIFSHHDTRPGGAWSAKGQDKNSGGIWNHIRIQSFSNLKIDKIKITPNIEKRDVSLSVDFNASRLFLKSHKSFIYANARTQKPKQMHLSLIPYNFVGKSYKKTYPFKSFGMQHLKLLLKQPKLWYTHDRGAQNLYKLTLTVGSTIYQQTIGLKNVIQDKNKRFILNGTPLYIKGTNYISSQYMSEMSEERLKKDLELMRDAHINTIRVHAHIEPKRFYDLCDEMGFLVWQDYNLQWGYIDTPAFHALALKEARDMVDILYNHVSILLWSMHNEPPWNSEWMKWKYPDYTGEENQYLDDRLYQTITHYDNYHIVKKISSNLEHPWFGWYSGDYHDFINDSKVPVISEYGAQALPNYTSLMKILPKKYLTPKGKKAIKAWEYHNFQFDWNKKNGITFKGDVSRLIKESQTYQASLIKYATEMLRIQKYKGTTAIFQFMFNEGWPSMNWGIVDYYREIKPGYTALQKAYAPIIVVAKVLEDKTIELYAVNDTQKAIERATLFVTYITSDTTTTNQFITNIPADSVVKIATLKETDIQKLEMSLEKRQQIAYNHYSFTQKREEKKQ